MPTAVVIETGQVDRLAARFEGQAAGITSRIIVATDKAAFDTERIAKANAPVDTGALRNEIHTAISVNTPGAYARDVISDMAYSRFVHDGTSRMAPRPYLRNAAAAVAPRFAAAMAQLADPLAGGRL